MEECSCNIVVKMCVHNYVLWSSQKWISCNLCKMHHACQMRFYSLSRKHCNILCFTYFHTFCVQVYTVISLRTLKKAWTINSHIRSVYSVIYYRCLFPSTASSPNLFSNIMDILVPKVESFKRLYVWNFMCKVGVI